MMEKKVPGTFCRSAAAKAGGTLKLSLIFPVYDSKQAILTRASDLRFFWARFPVDVEILFVADPRPDFSHTEIEDELKTRFSYERIQFRLIPNPRRLGRGMSVLRGLEEATGEILCVNSLDLSIPLAEVFSCLQEFIMNRDRSFLLLGNRRGIKKKRRGTKHGLRAFFEGVEHEKSRTLGVTDPTSPFWMIKKKDWQELRIDRLRSWFYTPQVVLQARKRGLPVHEIEVQSQDRPDSAFRLRNAFT